MLGRTAGFRVGAIPTLMPWPLGGSGRLVFPGASAEHATNRHSKKAMPSDLLVIAASNGENLKLAERFAAEGRQQGQRASVLDLTALALPLFTPRLQQESPPAALSGLEEHLRGAGRWVICTPEYNGSIPPVLTSAIAWLSVQGSDFRSLFNSRPVVIATHSGGGGTTVLAALRLQLAHLGAVVVGRQLVSNSANPAKDASINDLITRLLALPPT